MATDSNRALYNVCHDLKEPVSKVLVISEYLLEKLQKLDATDKDYLTRLNECGRRMKTMIDGLSSYVRYSEAPEKLESIELKNLWEEVLAELQPEIAASGGRIELKSSASIRGDRSQMKRVFTNLLLNSLQFAKEGQAPEVTIENRAEGKSVEITVTDQGMGFDEKYVQRMFEPFQTIHTERKGKAAGMGLAIAERIVRNHGGTLTAQSRLNEGASFRISLPNG